MKLFVCLGLRGDGLMRKRKFNGFIGIILIIIIIPTILFILKQKTFDTTKLDVKNEYKNIEELTSSKYAGRLAGSGGNKLALKYVENYFKKIGIEPGGDGGSYYQKFKSMVPMHNSKPYFRIKGDKGNIVKEYFIGKDYREYLDGYGGNGEVKSKLFHMTNLITQYKPQDLNGKIIVVDSMIGDNYIEFAIDNGVKAILCPAIDGIEKTSIYTENKYGKTVLVILLNQKTFNEVINYTSKGMIAEIKLDMKFKFVDTPNLIGKIQGKKKNSGYIILSSHIDGFGNETDGSYYPGAMDGASGTAMLMELARVIKSQKNITDKTIIFALWNNEEYGKKGKQHYTLNPIYPLNKSSIIYLNNIGGKNFSSYNIGYKGQASRILKDKMIQFSGPAPDPVPSEAVDVFIEGGANAISIEESMLSTGLMYELHVKRIVGTPADGVQAIDTKQLKKVTNFLLQFIKKEIYGDVIGGLLNIYEKSLVLFLGIAIFLIYVVKKMGKIHPDFKIHKTTIEDISYSTGFGLFERFIYYFSQISLIIITVVIITHVPFDFNLFVINGQIVTNFSWNEVIVKSMEYLRMLFTIGFGKTNAGYDVMAFVGYAFNRSFSLLTSVIAMAVLFGISKGMFDAFRDDEKSNRRTIGTIMIFSIPDVFIVILVQMLFIYFNKHNIFHVPSQYGELKSFVISFLSLIVLPSIYVARIAGVAVHEEIKKEYIKAARAKGLSNFLLIKNHLFISVFIKVIDALPTILSLIISNLIIVEYLSNYPGIVSNMMISYKNNEIGAFTGLALSLCFMYLAFIILFKIISGFIDPLKRRVRR